MPVYNSEKYVELAIEAILCQTYSDYELIISDNASTDRTAEICKAYAAKDPRIRYYRNSHNLGATPNANRVAELSSGEYFKWAFYDDLIAPQFLSKCIEVMDLDPSVVLCVPKANVINEMGELLGVNEYTVDVTSPKPHLRFENYVIHYGAAWELFGLIRSDVLKKTKFLGWYPGSDHVYLAELALYGKFHVIPEALLFPRHHAEQTWITTPKERDRLSYENTAMVGRIVLTKWGWVNGYLDAIRNAPLSYYERAHCCITILRWMARPDHFRALGKDILLATRQWFGQTFSMKSR